MDDFVTRDGPIDPEVRAYIYSLVTAIGGSSTSADGRYTLGDDALACLKDLKRWLKLYDTKLNRLDVTRCLAEANLIKGDLLEILALWSEEALENRWRNKIALACYELLVPLTWPLERDISNEMTRNQHRHLPYVQIAQINYKREILEHPSGDVLRKAVRLALPSMAVAVRERTQRDEGILKLLLYFLRNIAIISAPPNLPVEWNEEEVGRSATICAFERQEVFTVLLTMASNIAEDFRNQDVVVLEVLFHLLKGVDPEKLFMDRIERSAAMSKDLQGLMDKEAAMLKSHRKNAPTRHNRFGTMIWVKRDEERMSAVSGQDVLSSGQRALEKMDKSKKWNKPRRANKDPERNNMDFDMPETLSDDANEKLRCFVEEFLDSGFNPMFEHLRRAIEREAERVLEMHSQQYWYLISWFLRAESTRRKAKRQSAEKEGQATQIDSFGIIAGVLNQETFILLNRYMQSAFDNKEWNRLDAAMRCFTQILTTVQEMSSSPLDEDQEIAENIQNRIFYEESTHDRVLSILRTYKDQTFSYLDATTELSHVFFRMLERYTKENGDLQIRSRRKARRKKQDAQKKAGQAVDDNPDQGSEAEDNVAAALVSNERKFNFDKFATKFINQSTVDTFVKFVSYYRDLTPEQLKRAHRFFYRATFKQDLGVLLYRVDIIALFNRMIKSSDQLSKSNPMYREWEELARQIFKRLIRKLQERPELAVELLFSKIRSTCFYLEYGYEKQTVSSNPRAPAELEVKGALELKEQIGVVVAVLMAEQKVDHINWAIKNLQSVADERKAWEAQSQAIAATSEEAAAPLDASGGHENQQASPSAQPSSTEDSTSQTKAVPAQAQAVAVKPDNEARRLALFKDNKLRLLLTLSGAERIGEREDVEAPWYIPSNLTSTGLYDTISCIESHRDNPKNTYGNTDEDPIPAAEMLKRRAPPRQFDEVDVASEDEDALDAFLAGEDEHLFPAGGPTARKSALDELTKKRRRQRRTSDAEAEDIDDETREARRRAKAMRELEKRRKIKSEEFIHDSDDESVRDGDEAFFAKEREMAARREQRYKEALNERQEEESTRVAGKGKRKRGADTGKASKRMRSSDDEMLDSDPGVSSMDGVESDDDALFVRQRSNPAGKSATPVEISDTEMSTDFDDDPTPLSSQSEPRVDKLALSEADGNRVRPPDPVTAKLAAEADEDDDALPTQVRRRGMKAVLDDSDDD